MRGSTPVLRLGGSKLRYWASSSPSELLLTSHLGPILIYQTVSLRGWVNKLLRYCRPTYRGCIFGRDSELYLERVRLLSALATALYVILTVFVPVLVAVVGLVVVQCLFPPDRREEHNNVAG